MTGSVINYLGFIYTTNIEDRDKWCLIIAIVTKNNRYLETRCKKSEGYYLNY